MNKLQKIIFFNIFISNTGSYLTQIGLSIIVIENYGAAKLGLMILAQSCAFMLLRKSTMKSLENLNRSKLLALINLARGTNVGILLFNQSYISFFIYAIVSNILSSIYGPLQKAFISESLPENQINATFRKASALNGFSLAISPVIGVLILTKTNSSILFFLDVISYVIAASTCMFLTNAPKNTTHISTHDNAPLFKQDKNNVIFNKIYEGSIFWPAILWSLFLAVGALHEIAEMPYLKSIPLSNSEISFVISAWGIGSLTAFFVKSKFKFSDQFSAIVFTFSLITSFLLNYFYFILFGFFSAGFMYSFIIGNIRHKIHISAEKQKLSFVETWSIIERISLGINILLLTISVFFYTTPFKQAPIYLLAIFTLLFCIIYILVMKNTWFGTTTRIELIR